MKIRNALFGRKANGGGSKPGDVIVMERDAGPELQGRFDQAGRPIMTINGRAMKVRARADGSMPADGEDFDIDITLCSDDSITMRVWTWEEGEIEYGEVLSVEGLDLSSDRWPVPIGMNHNPNRVEDQIGVVSDARWVATEGGINLLQGVLHVSGDHPLARRIRTGMIRNFSVDYVVNMYRDVTGQDGNPDDMTTLVAIDWELFGACAVLFPADARAKTEVRAAFTSRMIEGDKDMTLVNGFRARKAGILGRSATAPAGTEAQNAPAAPAVEPTAPATQAAPAAPATQAAPAPAAPAATDSVDHSSNADAAFERAQNDADLIETGNSIGMERGFVARHLSRAQAVTPDQLTAAWFDHQARTARGGRGAMLEMAPEAPNAFGIGSRNSRFHGRAQALIRAAVAHNLPDVASVQLAANDVEARSVRSVGFCDLYREALEMNGVPASRGLHDNSRIHQHMADLRDTVGRSVAPNVLADFGYIVQQVANTVMLQANTRFPFIAAQFMKTVRMNSWYQAATLIMNEIDDLEELVEGQEIPAGGFQIFDDFLVLTTLGKRYPFSRQLIETNSGNVFSDFAENVLKAANRARTKGVLDMIKTNRVMKKDGLPFFHKDRGNVMQNMDLSDEDTMTAILAQIAGDDPSLLQSRVKLVVSYLDFAAAKKINTDKVVATTQDGVPVYAGMFDIVPMNGLPVDRNGRSGFIVCANPDEYAFLVNVEREGQGEPMIKMMEPEAYDAMVAKVIYDRGSGFGNPYKGVLVFSGPAPATHTLSNGQVIEAGYGL